MKANTLTDGLLLSMFLLSENHCHKSDDCPPKNTINKINKVMKDNALRNNKQNVKVNKVNKQNTYKKPLTPTTNYQP